MLGAVAGVALQMVTKLAQVRKRGPAEGREQLKNWQSLESCY